VRLFPEGIRWPENRLPIFGVVEAAYKPLARMKRSGMRWRHLACRDPPVRQMQMRIDIVIVYGILLPWSPDLQRKLGDARSQLGL
jgi:hypothetical protein